MTTPTTTGTLLAGRLRGHGWLDWTDTASQLADTTCAWADYRGFHVTSCPQQMPHTSHLWAWRGETVWRLRVDSGRALLAELTILPTSVPGDADTVTVRRLPGLAWPPDYEMIGRQPAGVVDGDYELYEVAGDPVTGSAAMLFVGRAQL